MTPMSFLALFFVFSVSAACSDMETQLTVKIILNSSPNQTSLKLDLKLVEENYFFEEEKEVCNYRDDHHKAFFSVVQTHHKNTPTLTYFGLLIHNGTMYTVEPIMSELKSCKDCSVIDESHYKISASMQDLSNEDLEGVFSSTLRKNEDVYREELYMKMVFVLDFDILKKWKQASKKRLFQTIKYLHAYFNIIAAQMAINFRRIKFSRYVYMVKPLQLYIAHSAADSVFLSVKKDKGNLNYGVALETANNWQEKRQASFQQHQFTAFFTNFRPTDSNEGSAKRSSACTDYKASIIYDSGIQPTSITLTRMISRMFGAGWDGEDNNCSPIDLHFMSPIPHNKYSTFSICSVESFEKYILSMRNTPNCFPWKLPPPKRRVKRPTTTKPLPSNNNRNKSMIGFIFSPDHQCYQHFGKGSYFCSNGEESDVGVCKEMRCYLPTLGRCEVFAQHKALDGTACGMKKWCDDEECVVDSEAPLSRESCVNGDRREYMSLGRSLLECTSLYSMRHLCYIEQLRSKCCRTCKKLEANKETCKYGDRIPNCSKMLGMCHSEHNKHLCCHTCQKIKEKNPEMCPYGDMYPNCKEKRDACSDKRFSVGCCDTCKDRFTVGMVVPECRADISMYCARGPFFCRTQTMAHYCCETCMNYEEKMWQPECHGDKYEGCLATKEVCQNSISKRSCCQTCKKYEKEVSEKCPTGDIWDDCQYNNHKCGDWEHIQSCCLSCEQFRKQNPSECPLGDKHQHCKKELCVDPNWKDLCCLTCLQKKSWWGK